MADSELMTLELKAMIRKIETFRTSLPDKLRIMQRFYDAVFSAGMRAGEIARWIPVAEKLPEIGQEVLAGAFIQCEFRDGRQTVSWQHCLQMWTGEKWIDADSGADEGATHWQPLPAAPEEKRCRSLGLKKLESDTRLPETHSQRRNKLMTKFAQWCDQNMLMPTMENADKFADEQRGPPMTGPERAWVEAILRDARTLGYRVLAVTLRRGNEDALVRALRTMSYSTPLKSLGDSIVREAERV